MAGVNLVDGLNEFCVKLYRVYSERDGNIFFSPFSISAGLLLVNLGADEDTEKQIRTALGSDNISKDEFHEYFKQFESGLIRETNETTTLSIANRIFGKLGLTFGDNYKAKSKKYYDSCVQLLDFIKDAEGSRMYINRWVEDQTRNKIRDLLSPGAVNAESLLVLVNAIYFKGKWLKPFKNWRTRKVDFYPEKSKSVRVDMMNGEEKVRYILDSNSGYSAVELPYRDGNIAMVFILPNAIEGLVDIEKKIDTGLMSDVLKKLKTADSPEVILGIPKFKMEAMYELKQDLPKVGIVDMFSPAAAKFSAMLPETPEIFLSSAIHKTFIEVGEEGTEAAVATAHRWTLGCHVTPPKQFIVDHPFIFLIRDMKLDIILFMGRYRVPPE